MFQHRLLAQALVAGSLLAAPAWVNAQDPAGELDRPSPANSVDLVTRMMKFDKNSDGKLTKAEITDARVVRLWSRADGDKNGSVTKSELEALDTQEQANTRNSFGGPGGPGGGPGGPGGGPGGPMGPRPKPGEVLPQMMRGALKLTADQQSQLDELQRDVDARMAKILTESQKTQLKQIANRGPGGPGGPGGGRGGPGGPGGPPGDEGFFPPPPR